FLQVKSEIRNSKSETNSKLVFGVCFGFRISSFGFTYPCHPCRPCPCHPCHPCRPCHRRGGRREDRRLPSSSPGCRRPTTPWSAAGRRRWRRSATRYALP